MELTIDILKQRIAGLTEAKEKAEQKEATRLIVPMLDSQIQIATEQLKALQKSESEKKNALGGENPSLTSVASVTDQSDPTSLAKRTDNSSVLVGDRIDDDIIDDDETLEKKNFAIIKNSKVFNDKKNIIYRHIRDWKNRTTAPTDAQKAKKIKVMESLFIEIEAFVRANSDYADEVLKSEYKISFCKVVKRKKETKEDFEKRLSESKDTFTLIWEDMKNKYF